MKYLLPFVLLLLQNTSFAQGGSESYKSSWKLSEAAGPEKAFYETQCKPFICSDGSAGCSNASEKAIYHTCCWTKSDGNKFQFDSEKESETFLILEWSDARIVLETFPKPGTKLTFVK